MTRFGLGVEAAYNARPFLESSIKLLPHKVLFGRKIPNRPGT